MVSPVFGNWLIATITVVFIVTNCYKRFPGKVYIVEDYGTIQGYRAFLMSAAVVRSGHILFAASSV